MKETNHDPGHLVSFDSMAYLNWFNKDAHAGLDMPITVFLHDITHGDYTRINGIDIMDAPSELWSFTDLLDRYNEHNFRIEKVVGLASLVLIQERLISPVTETARLTINSCPGSKTKFATFDERYGHTFRTRDYMIEQLRIKQGE